jgi:flagellar hook assembly protein FlgD
MVTPVNTNVISSLLLNSIKQQQSDFSLYLAAQLINQDPFAPIPATSLLQQQLASTQIQGQLIGNLSLAGISTASTLNLLFSASAGVGKTVQYHNNNLNLTSGQGTINYKLDAQATTMTIRIFDSNGNEVKSSTISQLGTSAPKAKGNNTFSLNTGNTNLNGSYTYTITAKDSQKNDVIATPFKTSQIQSAILDKGVVFIKMNNNDITDSVNLLQIS